MRSRRSTEHREAVERRLALLVPPEPADGPAPESSGEAPGTWGGPTRVRDVPSVLHDRAPLDDLMEPEPLPGGLGVLAQERVARAVPMPGRHASRRPSRLPAPPAHLRLGLVHLAVVAVVVALGLAVTSWWVVRSEPVPLAAPLAPAASDTGPTGSLVDLPSGSTGETTGGTGTAGEEDGAVVVVDVAGRVRRPGVLELPVGSRVVDAIEAAGGARGGVDLSGLNLARVLVDGEQVLVGPGTAAAGVPSGAGAGGAAGAPGGPAALVNLNTADQSLLESLPEVGPVTAQAILAWREEHGGFTAVQELLEVDGIGPATLETLAPLVTV
ncbi:MAG: ComEA family DNA-binding protein [Actinomycetota bacterium]|nr:ComEA family DNA-binding protein [Actinomycetota bacterium]